MTLLVPLLFFFFFQAEDGIRDLTVTGVQTCALPISRPLMLTRWLLQRARRGRAERQRRILPQQPVQNLYRPRQVRTLLERSGFRTARLITKVASPEAPLPGHYMRIYCLEAI